MKVLFLFRMDAVLHSSRGRLSDSKKWDLAKVFDWKSLRMDVKIPEEGFVPSVRIAAMPEYAGELYIDNIQFRRLK